MSQYVDSNVKTFIADEAIAQHLRVKLDSDGKVTKAGLTDRDIGTAENAAYASGDPISVRLRTASGTCKMVAIEAITVGSLVYTESDGKVQDTAASTAFLLGTAMETVSGDNSVIEVLRYVHGDTAAT
jgi:hypothetical protein